MTTQIEVSVIIVSYNRKNDLLNCIDSVLSIKYPSLEIILVDNASTDNSVEDVEKRFPDVRIIKNSKNLGADYPRNQGILVSKGKYIWFLDSDAIVTNKDCLKKMLKLLEDKDIGSVGGEVMKDNGILKYRPMINGKELREEVNQKNKIKYRCLEVDYLATCNCMVRKETLIKIGGFDTNYFYFYEDADIGFKIKKLNLKNIFSSKCVVFHNFSQSGRVSHYYLLFRNNLRGKLINSSLLWLLTFPFNKLMNMYQNFKQFNSGEKDISNLKTMKENEKGKYNQKFGLAKLSIHVCSCLFRAYVWNIIHLPKTLYIKYKHPNFLENVKAQESK